SQISLVVLGAFNTFLTTLGMLSILLIYFIFHDRAWAFLLAGLCGFGYFLVYALDLLKIFPISPDPMPHTLYIIEILGLIVSIPLMLYASKGFNAEGDSQENTTKIPYSKKFILVAVLLTLASIGIIVFATNAAMSN
ncbi:MAG: hypothetical protein PHH31_05340, partial [Acidaminococcaceae bacterium]|nr:hypothetical protein [Acidaminococcaceae bacterium]